MRNGNETVVLRHAAPEPRRARLREPSGDDELAVDGVDTRAAVQLLDRLLGPGVAAHLSASDRDTGLAALYRARWGDRIVATLVCDACGTPNDLSFELSALQRQLWRDAQPARVTGPRALADEAGTRWHLPAAADEEAAAELGLAAGCAQLAALAGGDAARLEALAPLIDVDLESCCTACSHVQLTRFDIQSFTLQRLLDERETVLDEVHALASAYGWPLRDILALPASQRRALVRRATAS